MANANTKIATFVNLCVTEGYKSPLSRSQIKALRAKYGCPMPAWLMKDEDRRVGHGKYACAELDAAWSARNGVAAAASVPAPVSAPAAVAAPAAPAMQARIARAESTLDGNFIPSKLMTYVPYGNYKDIEAIVKSKRWYPTMVTGLSGNGKTTMIEQVCAKLGRECIRVNLTSQTDADDLLGGFRLVNGDTVWQDGPVVTAMKRGAILLLDEMDTASHKIMCLMRVLEGKGAFLPKINTQVEPAAGFNVFATMNTKGQGGEGSEQFSSRSILDEALLERFSGTYEQDYPTKAVEKKIVIGNMEALACVDEPFADCLVKWAEMIRKTYMEGGADAIITTRRLCMIVDNFSIFADRTKAVTAACARFSNSTKEAFVNLYSKVDAEVSTVADPARAAALEAEAVAAAVAKATRFDLKGAAFQDRAAVKTLGAQWDATAKVWFISGDQYRANPSAFDAYKPTPVSA
jgi:MoxR-like ATPase